MLRTCVGCRNPLFTCALVWLPTETPTLAEATSKLRNVSLKVHTGEVLWWSGFREELLGLVPLEGRTTGEVIFQKIVTFFNEHELDLQKVCLLVTDGALAMTSRVKGLVARLAAVAPHTQFLHRIIHQAVLCAKLSGDLKNTMDTVMNIVNFIRSTSSLQYRLLRMLPADASTEHTDLLVHNDVRSRYTIFIFTFIQLMFYLLVTKKESPSTRPLFYKISPSRREHKNDSQCSNKHARPVGGDKVNDLSNTREEHCNHAQWT